GPPAQHAYRGGARHQGERPGEQGGRQARGERAAEQRRAGPRRGEQQARTPADVAVAGVGGQGRRGGEDDDDEARGGGGDRGGDGQDAAAAPERAQRDTDEGARGQGEKERTHATVPLPSRPGGRGKDGTGAVTCRPAREVGAPSWDGRVGYPARGPCAASAAGRAGAQGCLRRVVIPVVLLRQACVVVRPARSAPSKPSSTATTSRPAASSRDAAIAARMPPAQCTQTWPSGISASRPR